MSNIINFQEAIANKRRFEESTKEAKENFYKMSRALMQHYREMAVILKGGSFNPTLIKFHHWFAKAMELSNREILQEEMLRFGGSIVNTGDFLDRPNNAVYCCFRLTNNYDFGDIKRDTLVPLAMGTKEGLLKTYGYDVDLSMLAEHPLAEVDIGIVRGVVYDYIYSHPDVDTDRDVGTTSVLAYELVGYFCEAGYELTDWHYNKVFDPETKRNMPSELIMKFELQGESDLEKEIFLIYDQEIMMQCVHGMFENIFNSWDEVKEPQKE